jgi:hypothetical protein
VQALFPEYLGFLTKNCTRVGGETTKPSGRLQCAPWADREVSAQPVKSPAPDGHGVCARLAAVTLRQCLHGLLLLGVFYVVSGTTGDPDLWGHVRFGQDMLTHGAVRLSDAYSFTSDRPWINHEWLSEIAFAVAFNMLGPIGLNLCRIIVVAAVLGLVWRASTSLSDRHRVTMVVVCAVGTYMRAHAMRPQIFSLLMFAILLVLLKSSDEQRSLRPLLWVPALMAVWVNFHGGWIVGFGVFGLWCGRAALEGSRRDRVRLMLALSFSLAATLLNPYGARMWEFLATTVRLERPMVVEWQPLYQRPYAVWLSWLVALGVAGIGARHATSRSDWLNVGIVAGLGVAALRVSRLDAFFALAAIFLTIRMLQTHAEQTTREPLLTDLQPSMRVATAFVLCALAIGTALVPRIRTVPLSDQHVPDADVAAYVRDRKLEGKLLTWFNWGEYSIWHFGPDLKVSMDGRRETVYGSSVIADHLRFYFGTSDEWRYADQLKADYVWIPKHLAVARTLQMHGWSTLCAGETSILLTRQASTKQCASPASATRTRVFPEL